MPGPYEIDGGERRAGRHRRRAALVAFALDCLRTGMPYTWKGRSPALDEAIDVLGVGALLE